MPLAQEQQQKRLLNLDGVDDLLLTAIHGHEEMSRLFSFQLSMISSNTNISPEKVVGKNVTFSIDRGQGSRRFFNGFVSQFAAGDEGLDGQGKTRREYRAEVVPWLWFLTQTADCRIFQNKTIPQIVEQIFKDLGFNDFDPGGIKGDHKEWVYCVQYRETDFNFVSRLLEQEGIFYFFKHENKKHTLVLADQIGAYQDCPEKQVDYPRTSGTRAIADHIASWEHEYEFRTGKWAHTDYNFETPSTSLMANTKTTVPLPGVKKYEVYDYPGEYSKKAEGQTEVKLRIQEEEVAYDVVSASSSCQTFTPGGKFTVGEHQSESEKNKSYVITSIDHSVTEQLGYETGVAPGEGYSNTFTCIPDSVTFRPARMTPKPLVSGVQTAVVVGKAGEEIYCDKYGRVKVQFHWDREGKRDEKSSCWIRVGHNMAGKKWGFMSIPRIGQEVIVDFLEGDPDRPIIVGSVYNAEQMPHYDLPTEQTKSYIKTNSSKGGKGFNEIRFEDKADKEQIFIHAERNMDTRVKNDSKARIYGSRHQIIGWEKDGKKGGDQREMVYKDKQLNVKGHQIEHIEGNCQLLIGKGKAADGGKWDIVVEKDKKELIGAPQGSYHLEVNGDQNIKLAGNHSLDAAAHQETLSGDMAIAAQGNIYIQAGMNLVLEAGVKLSVKVGGNFVDVSPMGVAINGTMVLINSGGAAGSGTGAKPTPPEKPEEAAPAEPAMADNSTTGFKSC